MPPESVRAVLTRLLRQRLELGVSTLFLDSLDRHELLALLDARRARHGSGRAPSPYATHVASGPRSLALAGDAVSYEALRNAALQCTRCRLHERRTQAVFSDGNPRAPVLIVGEAPGQEEDRRGLPFVGPAGKLLDLLLASISLSRESVYICNVVKCRPPANRNPEPDEIEACHPFLRAQIEFVSPKVILALGSIAAHTLLGRQDALTRLRGVVHRHDGIPVVVTYHPAALLRNAGWTRVAWEDFQLMRSMLALGSGGVRD